MKSSKYLFIVLISIMSSMSLLAQNNNDQQTEESVEKIEVRQALSCPMKCEGEKTYTNEGECPKCGMKLKNEHAAEDKAQYICPMKCEGDKKYIKEGSCPKCHMDLKKEKKK